MITYINLLTWWLSLHENIYHQWRTKLIDEETFASWTQDLEYGVRRIQLGSRWSELNTYFETSFARHVTAILARQANEAQ
jgi:hypothetical protein